MVRFNVASAFPAEAATTILDIVEKSGLHPVDAEQLILHGFINGLFLGRENGVIAHSASTQAIAKVPHLADWVAMVANEMWPSATRVVDAMEKRPTSQEIDQTGFNIAHGTKRPFLRSSVATRRDLRVSPRV